MRLAAVDMGSNSFHLVVVDAHADGSFETLLREKEMLRLGEVVTRTGAIPPADEDRIVATMARFAAMAASIGAEQVVACATSAMREAENSAAIVDRIAAETGIAVQVISGHREAELIFSAIRQSVALDPAPAICFDLGGGSLEVMVGDHRGLTWATSVHLGVARLATAYLQEDPPRPEDLAALQARVREVLAPVARHVAPLSPRLLVGTSGTLLDLARMANASKKNPPAGAVNQLVASRADLARVHERLVTTPAAGRSKLPGLDARRADQIPAGSALLLTVLDLFGFDEMMVGEWALREGIVLDAMRAHDVGEWTGDAGSVRRSSVASLARRCDADDAHATQVARLAEALFDGTATLHGGGEGARELLGHAAVLHDIGEHVAVEGHHRHTAYLIEHGRLRGFRPWEIDALVTLGRFHRRGQPKPSFEPFGRLSSEQRTTTLQLLALLQLADGLDRGHSSTVAGVEVDVDAERVRIAITATANADLEVWGLRRKRDLFEQVFGRRIEVVAPDDATVDPH